jgi:hypothetical protein
MRNRIEAYYNSVTEPPVRQPDIDAKKLGKPLSLRPSHRADMPCCPMCCGRSVTIKISGENEHQVVCTECGVAGPVTSNRLQAITTWRLLSENASKNPQGNKHDDLLETIPPDAVPGIWSLSQFLIVLAVIVACWIFLLSLMFL